MSSKRWGLLASAQVMLLVACSGSQANTRADEAHIAQNAADPRTNDPTATQAGAAAPISTTSLNVGSSIPPAGTSGGSSSSPPSTTGSNPADRPAEVDPPRKIGARHVLIQWMGSDRAGKSVLRTREQAMVLAKEVLRRARAGEDLGRLAVEYSDEPNAGARGGSLGRFSAGQMVPAFEAVAFKLKVGEISEIVETPFGFHIIQRTE